MQPRHLSAEKAIVIQLEERILELGKTLDTDSLRNLVEHFPTNAGRTAHYFLQNLIHVALEVKKADSEKKLHFISYLLSQKICDPNHKINGVSPLRKALFGNEHPAIVQVLLEHKANPNEIVIHPSYAFVDHVEPLLYTLCKLSRASDKFTLDYIQLLLNHGATPDLPDNLAHTPLLQICKKYVADDATSQYYIRIAELLINKGADINQRWRIFNPLIWACDCGNIPLVKFLLSKKASVEKICDDHNKFVSPLHVAVSDGHDKVETVQLLLQSGANKDTRDDKKRSLLHYAVEPSRDNPNVTAFLLDIGFDINEQDSEKQSPLHIAIRNSRRNSHVNYRTISLLITRGANLEARDSKGKTPKDLLEIKDFDGLPDTVWLTFQSCLAMRGDEDALKQIIKSCKEVADACVMTEKSYFGMFGQTYLPVDSVINWIFYPTKDGMILHPQAYAELGRNKLIKEKLSDRVLSAWATTKENLMLIAQSFGPKFAALRTQWAQNPTDKYRLSVMDEILNLSSEEIKQFETPHPFHQIFDVSRGSNPTDIHSGTYKKLQDGLRRILEEKSKNSTNEIIIANVTNRHRLYAQSSENTVSEIDEILQKRLNDAEGSIFQL